MAIDPSKLIDVGTTANDGTGDPIRTAFQKANTLFTELWDDDEGDVNSVTGSGGLTASPTTGAVVVSLNDDSITYAKLGTEFTTSAAVAATNLDFSTAQVFTKTLTGDTTLTFSNTEIGMVKDLVITGDHALTLPAGSTVAGTYDGTVSNLIQILVTGASQYWFSISQAQ
jgi:hypothetical protein